MVKVDFVLLLIGVTIPTLIVAIAALALNRGATSSAAFPIRKGLSGFWGDISSSVDWCEENYLHNPYVAETHNTITSGIIAIIGWLGLRCARRCGAEKRHQLLAVLLVIIGLGSIAFHAALRHWMQMLDEVPMLWIAVASSYCVLEGHAPAHGVTKHGMWLPIVLTVWTAVISAVTIFNHGATQVVCFYLSFLSAQFVAIIDVLRIMLSTDCAETKQLCRGSFAVFALSVLAWCADGLMCSRLQNLPYNIPNPQLHAWGWHVGVGCGVYGLFLAGLYERLRFLHIPVKYVWRYGFWPEVALVDAHDDTKHPDVKSNGHVPANGTARATSNTSTRLKAH